MNRAPRVNRLHKQVAALLAQEIVSGRLPALSPIPSEPDLVAGYGVSKTVARETVQALAAANLVTIQHGKRTTVRPEEEWDFLSRLVQEALRAEGRAETLISDLYEVRLLLEPTAARWAAQSARPDQIDKISRALRKMEDAIPIAPGDFLESDRDFHFVILAAASGNRVLKGFMRDIHELLATSWAWSELTPKDIETVFGQHRQIADAIASGDADEAEAAMRRHVKWAAKTDRRGEKRHGSRA